jgi:glyoxylase-like metal-dependent hydrolase (beta-lactamase superfamily II)
MNRLTTFVLIIATIPCTVSAKGKDHLSLCWGKQVKPLQESYINLNYRESSHTIAHLFEPWQTYHSAATGVIWCNGDQFLKKDTLERWERTSYSKTQLNKTELLYLDYNDKDLSKITKSNFDEEPFAEARYSPTLLISYFHNLAPAPESNSDKDYAIYIQTIDKTIVQFYIRKSDDLLEKVTTFSNDDLYGDVTNTIYYSGFSENSAFFYPSIICVDKTNGKVKDTIMILSAAITSTAGPLLERPADYHFSEEKVIVPELSVEHYNNHIHFITLKHTNGRSMVVEFKDYLLVAEAPLNSENGELIINEAKKIAPGKPIRYFIFGHYHPDYIGGMRAFVHKGASVLCSKGDSAYVRYLATAAHTLKPDSLQLQPHPLQIEDIGEHKIISDGTYKMDIHLIGTKSEHTKDYLIYYFPLEKMVFEDDLAGIPEKGPIRKAGKRQTGLYNAIKDLKLDVTTVEQSWPVGYGAKTEIPFSDLETAMTVK